MKLVGPDDGPVADGIDSRIGISGTLFEADAFPQSDPEPHYLASYLELLPSVGPHMAGNLRAGGLDRWEKITRFPEYIPRSSRGRIVDAALAAQQALVDRDLQFFTSRMPRRDHWRLAAAFPERTVFLDIETTGLSRVYHQLTLTGWATEGSFHALLGVPSKADSEALSAMFERSILVTYNGAHFDLPFLKEHLPLYRPPASHVDLRHLGRRLDLVGGQKKIEQQLGLERDESVRGLDGELAPALWFQYQRGDLDALSLLIEYNHADVDGLRLLLSIMSRRMEPKLEPAWTPSSFSEWLTQDNARTGNRVLTPYLGRVGPRLTLKDTPAADTLVVVGIDLSGGPKSVTGWSRIRGGDAITAPMRTDEEIISRTLEADPDIVSIDAPLSLPVGRNHVGDDDPARPEFGITRAAERELWKRGVNTYPALIRSMQGLTARGITLAALFRRNGIPVIESFPGAMQDMLGMPRKGLSLAHLRQSLVEYGLHGPFVDSVVTHDEIDALSSAIVGQLFWEGRYEGLGNEDEDYLIVPDLDANPSGPRQVVGLSGRTASGKTTLAALLQAQGFHRIRYSEILGRLFPPPPGPADRSYLRQLGRRIHEEKGQRWLGARVVERARTFDRVVIDGIRFPEDRAFLIERFGRAYEDVHLDVDRETRRERFIRRLGSSDDFDTADNDLTEIDVDMIRARARHTLDNSGSLYRLEQLANDLAGSN